MTVPSYQFAQPKNTACFTCKQLVLGIASCIAWLAWPSEFGGSVVGMSRADGKPRFQATTYSKADLSSLTLWQRLTYAWMDYRKRKKPNPGGHSFPASPVRPCSIHGLLNQCMDISGTKYLIAVEVLGGTVDFGYTNTLNGTQWKMAFEHAITSQSVGCFGYLENRTFKDKLILIREKPDLVKVVPRTKLPKYRKAGLIKGEIDEASDE